MAGEVGERIFRLGAKVKAVESFIISKNQRPLMGGLWFLVSPQIGSRNEFISANFIFGRSSKVSLPILELTIKIGMSARQRKSASVDEELLDVRRGFKDVPVRHDYVGYLPYIERADFVIDAKNLRGIESH